MISYTYFNSQPRFPLDNGFSISPPSVLFFTITTSLLLGRILLSHPLGLGLSLPAFVSFTCFPPFGLGSLRGYKSAYMHYHQFSNNQINSTNSPMLSIRNYVQLARLYSLPQLPVARCITIKTRPLFQSRSFHPIRANPFFHSFPCFIDSIYLVPLAFYDSILTHTILRQLSCIHQNTFPHLLPSVVVTPLPLCHYSFVLSLFCSLFKSSLR